MPEIWLGYGSTNVVLDIKQENLIQFASKLPSLSDDEIKNILSNIVPNTKTLFFLLSGSKQVLRILSFLLELTKPNPVYDIAIATLPSLYSQVKDYFSNIDVSVNPFEQKDFEKLEFDSVMFISRIIYDPLFGFGGTPAIISRNYNASLMTEIFSSNLIEFPTPGIIGEPLKMALQFCAKANIHSIDIVTHQNGVSHIYYGNTGTVFKKGLSDFTSITKFTTDEVKSIIISSGQEPESHFSLTDSLNSLWNSISVLKKNGSAILLSESSRGIGDGALRKYIEGRLHLKEIKKGNYIKGLEHLIYISHLKDDYNLGIISSIPFYYTKTQLGFAAFNNVKDVLGNLLSRYGRNTKVLVSTDPDITLLKKQNLSL